MMTKKEIVMRTIRFQRPERLSISFPSQNDDDICSLDYNQMDNQELCVGRDEWGCVWRAFDKTIGNVFIHPLDNWNKLKKYPFPNPNSKNRFDNARKVLETGEIKDYYIMGSVNFTLFERMHFLRGFNELLMDIYLNPSKILALAEIVTDFQVEIIKGWAKLGVDGLTFSDDWGTQNDLIINPSEWKNIFEPFYSNIFGVAHEHNLDVFFHSDGQIFKIIPDLIECGVDVLEIPQPRLIGIERLSREFAGRIAFYGCVDKQTTMVYGNFDEIETEVKLLIKSFFVNNGGFIAREPGGGYFSDYKVLEIKPEKVNFAYEIFKREGEHIYMNDF